MAQPRNPSPRLLSIWPAASPAAAPDKGSSVCSAPGHTAALSLHPAERRGCDPSLPSGRTRHTHCCVTSSSERPGGRGKPGVGAGLRGGCTPSFWPSELWLAAGQGSPQAWVLPRWAWGAAGGQGPAQVHSASSVSPARQRLRLPGPGLGEGFHAGPFPERIPFPESGKRRNCLRPLFLGAPSSPDGASGWAGLTGNWKLELNSLRVTTTASQFRCRTRGAGSAAQLSPASCTLTASAPNGHSKRIVLWGGDSGA